MTDETGYTYEDAARLCGVSAEMIRQRARRGSIRRGRPTNSKRPTVLLTADEVQAIRAGRLADPGASGRVRSRPDGQPVAQPDDQPDEPASLVALLRDQLARAEARVERLEARESEARTLAEAREVEARAAAERQARELTAALLRTAIAETEVRALRESLTEARRPAWRRWLGLN